MHIDAGESATVTMRENDWLAELFEQRRVDALTRHHSEREICELVWVVATNHLFNLTNRGLGIGSDGLCELNHSSQTAAASAS
jgi:hypothetical protein